MAVTSFPEASDDVPGFVILSNRLLPASTLAVEEALPLGAKGWPNVGVAPNPPAEAWLFWTEKGLSFGIELKILVKSGFADVVPTFDSGVFRLFEILPGNTVCAICSLDIGGAWNEEKGLAVAEVGPEKGDGEGSLDPPKLVVAVEGDKKLDDGFAFPTAKGFVVAGLGFVNGFELARDLTSLATWAGAGDASRSGEFDAEETKSDSSDSSPESFTTSPCCFESFTLRPLAIALNALCFRLISTSVSENICSCLDIASERS